VVVSQQTIINFLHGNGDSNHHSGTGFIVRKTITSVVKGVKGKGKVVPVLNEAPRHEDVLREWRYSSTHS
jgi:hypothetical protein